MAAPSYSDVNKKLKEKMATAKPVAAPEAQATPPAGSAEPSTLETVATGAGGALLSLLPQALGYAFGGKEGLDTQVAKEKAQSELFEKQRNRQAEIDQQAAQLAAQAQRLALEQKKADAEEQYKQQKLEIDQMDAQTKRMQAMADKRKEKEPKEGQFTSAGFAKRMEQAEADLAKIEGFNPTSESNLLTKWAPEALKSSGRKQFEQARRNFINAVLRKESGAAISESEFENANQQYFPSPGDTPDVLMQKAQNRQLALAAMKASSGKAYDAVSAALPPGVAMAGAPAASIGQNQAQAAQPEQVTMSGKLYQKQGGRWVPVK